MIGTKFITVFRRVASNPPSVRNVTGDLTGTIILPTRLSGDVLLLGVMANDKTEVTPSGWTLLQGAAAGSFAFVVYWKVSDGIESAPSYPIPSASQKTWICYSIANASLIQDSAISSIVSSNTVNAPTVTSTGTKLLVTFGGQGGGVTSATLTMPGTQTSTSNYSAGNNATIRAGYEIVSAGATGVRTVTSDTSASFQAANIVVG